MNEILMKIALTSMIVFLSTIIWSKYEEKTFGDMRWITAFIGVVALVIMIVTTLVNIWI